jgi:hypothetical protein
LPLAYHTKTPCWYLARGGIIYPKTIVSPTTIRSLAGREKGEGRREKGEGRREKGEGED